MCRNSSRCGPRLDSAFGCGKRLTRLCLIFHLSTFGPSWNTAASRLIRQNRFSFQSIFLISVSPLAIIDTPIIAIQYAPTLQPIPHRSARNPPPATQFPQHRPTSPTLTHLLHHIINPSAKIRSTIQYPQQCPSNASTSATTSPATN
jgi:hypothetical protein